MRRPVGRHGQSSGRPVGAKLVSIPRLSLSDPAGSPSGAIGWKPDGSLRQRFAETLRRLPPGRSERPPYRPSETELILLDKLGL